MMTQRHSSVPNTSPYLNIKEVINSGVIPRPKSAEIIYLGLNWFKETETGACYHVERKDGILTIVETRKSVVEYKVKQTHITIKCCDCGAERVIATQDAFQVKRCKDCQRKLRNEKRKIRMYKQRAKIKELKGEGVNTDAPKRGDLQQEN
jgi:ribosomal protein S27E